MKSGRIIIPKRKTTAPPITRVHKLFRLRTIVNDIPSHVPEREAGATSKDIGQILVDRKLSKTSILETTDKLKRARDHANNASFLGLLIPIPHDHEFLYKRSIFGELLSKYRFDDECPKDLHESAVFTDRIMRLKLTNPYDSRHTYSKFHCRPFLNILTILKYRGNLHIDQAHYVLSLTGDVSSEKELLKKTLDDLSEYAAYDDESIARFEKEFRMTSMKTKNEVRRSTKPLLDWVQQLDLIGTQENDWYFIKEKGLVVQKLYSSLFPIWFDKLGFDPAFATSLLLIYMYSYIKKLRISYAKLPSEAREILESLNDRFKLWDQTFWKLKQPIDFDLSYDVPWDLRDSVLAHVKKLNMIKIDPSELSLWPITRTEEQLSATGTERIQGELSKALGISIPRRECFQTDLEWQICLKLRLLQLPASPYQGEFEGETDLPMATDNPDIVVRNNVKCLVECKSASEWGKVIILSKKIGGELHMYQSYVEEINANSAVFVCEGAKFDEKRFIPSFVKEGNKLNKVVLLTWTFLDRAQKDQENLRKLYSTIENPESVTPQQRILA